MNTFQVKLLAVILMVVDHMGYFLWPSVGILRIVGRLSFPLFAFLIVKGYAYTSNYKKFFLRLFIFANIIQIPVFWMDIPFNIFYTLSFGLAFICIYDKDLKLSVKLLLYLGIGFLTLLINPDYSLYGVGLIVIIYVFKDKWVVLAIAMTLLSLFFYGITIQLYAVLALPIMMAYNEKLGPRVKWLFYLFYPVHIVVLNVISESMRSS